VRRHFLLASVGAIALTGSAFAADLALPPPPAPIFTWTGSYIGGQIGYAWGSGNLNYTGFDPRTGLAFTTGLGGSSSGVIGGAHVGYNYQFNQWVVGLEGSVDGTSISNTVVGTFPAFGGSTITASTNANIQGSFRGRAGIAWDRALIYATGGVALGGFTTDYTFTGNNNGNHNINGGNVFYGSNSFSNTRVGWTVGGGIDYAVTNNWSIFAEYRYTNWGTVGNQGLAAAGFQTVPNLTNAFINSNHSINQNQVQVGFSYKFDMYVPAPVIAKY
jgi:outer membrane immunogenic protein